RNQVKELPQMAERSKEPQRQAVFDEDCCSDDDSNDEEGSESC
ncbi:hypothetical protein CCACVL1_25299, partial [Corchorus capsularis]